MNLADMASESLRMAMEKVDEQAKVAVLTAQVEEMAKMGGTLVLANESLGAALDYTKGCMLEMQREIDGLRARLLRYENDNPMPVA